MKTEHDPESSDATQPEPSIELSSVTSEPIPVDEVSREPEREVAEPISPLEVRRQANLRRNSEVMKQVLDEFQAGTIAHF
jgi:hypothetical protein